MTVSRRKNKPVAKQDDNKAAAAAESGVQYHCDICGLDISSTVRISCATCASAPGALDTYDLCCSCFLEGAESATHKAYHNYRVVEQHAYPIFCDDWGADEELLLIDGAQIYGLGNWSDIADHIGNRTKDEVQHHYISVYVEGRDGTSKGDVRAEDAVRQYLSKIPSGSDVNLDDTAKRRRMLPVVGPNPNFKASIDVEEFQRRKRQRIEDARSSQAAFGGGGSASQQQSQQGAAKPAPPKPLVSAPTSHSELATFMPGRLEFEVEYENDAENYVKDMEFGKVYRFGGETIPSEMEALGRKAEQGRVRMEGSGRGGPGLGQRGAKGTAEEDDEKGGGDATEMQDDEHKDDEENVDEEMKDAEDGAEEDEDDDDQEDDDQSKVDQTVDGDETTANATDSRAATASASQPAETDDRAADWDEDEADLELKLIVLDIYNERLSRRGRRKEFIFERNLVDYKRTVAAERKRPKEEREMLNRVRHFAQMQTTTDFEEFYNGLCYEDALRRAAAQLQMFRRAGITTLTDAARFESEQTERARRAAVAAEGGLAAFPGAGSVPRSAAARAAARETSTPGDSGSDAVNAVAVTVTSSKKKGSASANGGAAHTTTGADGEKKPARKPPRPLDLSSHPSLNLLTRAEQELCSTIRIQPQVFMIMKKDIVVEYVRRKGKFSRRESRQLFKCDVNKVGKVYDLLESEGYLREAGRLGNGWDGTGTPPGWLEKPSKVNGGGGDQSATVGTPGVSATATNGASEAGTGSTAPTSSILKPAPSKLVDHSTPTNSNGHTATTSQ